MEVSLKCRSLFYDIAERPHSFILSVIGGRPQSILTVLAEASIAGLEERHAGLVGAKV